MDYVDLVEQGVEGLEPPDAAGLRVSLALLLIPRVDADNLDVGSVDPPQRLVVKRSREAEPTIPVRTVFFCIVNVSRMLGMCPFCSPPCYTVPGNSYGLRRGRSRYSFAWASPTKLSFTGSHAELAVGPSGDVA